MSGFPDMEQRSNAHKHIFGRLDDRHFVSQCLPGLDHNISEPGMFQASGCWLP